MPKHLRFPALILLIALAAHWVIATSAALAIQAFAVLVLTGFLPGSLLVTLWLQHSSMPWDVWERSALSIGCGYTVMVVGMLLISYLPGGISAWLPLAVFDLLLLLLVGLYIWRQPSVEKTPPPAPQPHLRTRRRLLLGLLVLLFIGGFLRFTHLGYAEFLTDEVRAILRAQAVIQGDETVLFVHRKGPTEILLPAVIFSITGSIDEATARLPFAIASLAGLVAVFCLGRRLQSPLAGWIATLLLTFDGYLIGFARFTQYQSVVFLTSVLVILLLYRLVETDTSATRLTTAGGENASRILIFAALLLATGLLSHYDAALTVFPAGWLLGLWLWRNRQNWPVAVRSVGLALLVVVGLLLLFYPRFLLHPQFQATFNYLVDRRITATGLRFPYNNLADIFQRSVIYNSAYAVIPLIGLGLIAVVIAYRRGWRRQWVLDYGLVVTVLVGVTALRPDWLKFGEVDLALLPPLLALLGLWLAPRLSVQERLLWLWFGLLAVLAYFFVAFPRTHVYTFFAPRALLIGALLAQLWRWLYQRYGERLALTSGALVTTCACLVFGIYAYWYFVDDRFEVLRTWQENRPSGYWLPTGDQTSDGLYGFPVQNGWKVIGVLYDQGILQGDYETNQRDNLISQWYTRGQDRCSSTATWYFQIDSLETWSMTLAVDQEMLYAQGYRRWGVVEVNGAPRLTIYQLGAAEHALQIFRWEQYAPLFDQLARTPFPLQYPAIEPRITHPMQINFGNQIWLEGYDLEHPEPLHPGATVRLTLYWRGQQPGLPAYKVFNHVLYDDGTLLAQQDSHPVCDSQRTSAWYPGELVADRREIVLPADAPVGTYSLYSGLYLEEGLTRLPIVNSQGEAVDQQVQVANLTIESTP